MELKRSGRLVKLPGAFFRTETPDSIVFRTVPVLVATERVEISNEVVPSNHGSPFSVRDGYLDWERGKSFIITSIYAESSHLVRVNILKHSAGQNEPEVVFSQVLKNGMVHIEDGLELLGPLLYSIDFEFPTLTSNDELDITQGAVYAFVALNMMHRGLVR